MPLPFESREEVHRVDLQESVGAAQPHVRSRRSFCIGKQYSVEHRKPGGNRQQSVHDSHARICSRGIVLKMTQFLPLLRKNSVRKQIAGATQCQPNAYVARSETVHARRSRSWIRPDTRYAGRKSCPGSSKSVMPICTVLRRADFPNRKQIVHEILHPEDRPAPQKRIYRNQLFCSWKLPSGAIQQDVDFLMKISPQGDLDDAYCSKSGRPLKNSQTALRRYMAQFEELLNDEKIA